MIIAQQLALDMPPTTPATTDHQRPLTTRDALWTLDGTTGQRIARPLVVDHLAGTWAARGWMHCGSCDGVLLVRWNERDNPKAPAYWTGLADGRVRLIVTANVTQAGGAA